MSHCERCAELERENERLRDEVERRAAEGAAMQDRMNRTVGYALEAFGYATAKPPRGLDV